MSPANIPSPPLTSAQAAEILGRGLPKVEPAVNCADREELEEFIYDRRNLEQPSWQTTHQTAHVAQTEFISESSAAIVFSPTAVPRRRRHSQYPQTAANGAASSSTSAAVGDATYRPLVLDSIIPVRPDKHAFHANVNPFDMADQVDQGQDAPPPPPPPEAPKAEGKEGPVWPNCIA